MCFLEFRDVSFRTIKTSDVYVKTEITFWGTIRFKFRIQSGCG